MATIVELRKLNARLMAEAAVIREFHNVEAGDKEAIEQSIVDRHGERELDALKQHARWLRTR